jgi:hypothetical protein
MAMNRRHVVSGGLAAGVAAVLGSAPASAAQRQADSDERTAAAVDQLREAIDRGQQVSAELTRIREQQRAFLKANNKFPDYIEIGISVWESVLDWHIRHQRPFDVVRTGEGRYAVQVMETLLILRPEQAENYVGFGFDAR